MYDLPSGGPQQPGLPDDFHLLQPHLLSETFHPDPEYKPAGDPARAALR
jgi:hypothetical protein